MLRNQFLLHVIPKAIEKIDDRSIRLIDQTKLPLELKYLELADYRDVITAIKKLQVRGAPAIGIAAAYGMAIAVTQSENFDLALLEAVAKEFRASRPTAVNLFWAVDRMLNSFRKCRPKDLKTAVHVLWHEAEAIHEEDRLMCERIGEHGAELFESGESVLTHCNAGAIATGGIGTALGVVYTCLKQGKKLNVIADETRPLLQGARLTTWELMEAGVDVTLICDNTAGMMMQQGRIDKVIVGADRIAANGDFANKIGTYSVAVLAADHKVPFFVAAPSSTYDTELKSGDEIIIEERASSEVTCGFGTQTAPDGVKVYSPAFDVTPHRLVSCYITDTGLTRGGRSD